MIEAWGDTDAVAAAYAAAWRRFASVLGELVDELASLKAPVGATAQVRGPVAARMVGACLPFARRFITPMAAVAGSVADEMRQFFAVAGIARAYVNNGGDIALHVAPGQTLTIGVVPDAYRPSVDGDMVLDARRDPAMWSKFNAGLEGSAWYLLRMHQQLSHRLPHSRSTELLGEAVREILASDPFLKLVPNGMAAAVWAASYAERQQG